MNKVSTRMLRHYDKIGLLKPIIDGNNNYRYYSEKQIEIISKIKELRACSFSLDEIYNIIENNNEVFLKEASIEKLKELSKLTGDYEKSINNLREIIDVVGEESFDNIYEISLTKKDCHNRIVCRENISEYDIDVTFDEIHEIIENRKLKANSCSILLNNFNRANENNYKVSVGIREIYNDDKYETKMSKKGKYISTIHYGDYNNIGNAYNSIIKYASKNNIAIDNSFEEKYLLDGVYTSLKNEYITEVSTLIINTP